MGNSQPRERMKKKKKTDFSGWWCVERVQSRTTGERRTDCSHCRLVTQRKSKWLSVCDNLICALKLTNNLIKRNKLWRSSSKNWLSRNTGNSLHTAFSLVHPQFCQQFHSSSHAQFCGTIGDGLLVAHIFTDGQRRTAAGRWRRSTMRSSAERLAAWADFARWRGPRRC